MKRKFTPLKESRCCDGCKHMIKNDLGNFYECSIYKGRNSSEKLIISKKQKVWHDDCPLETGNLNDRGMFYFKRRIQL